jgi:predicted RNase H-like HicB family nuclease
MLDTENELLFCFLALQEYASGQISLLVAGAVSRANFAIAWRVVRNELWPVKSIRRQLRLLMRNYIAFPHKEDSGVSFSDFPRVVAAGTAWDDARAMAEETLAFHIEGPMAEGGAIPDPSNLGEIMAGDSNRDGGTIVVPIKI